MLKNFTNRRAETILEVTIALFIIGVGITVSSMVLNRILNVTAQNKLLLQATFLAKEGIEGVQNLRDTNSLRYADLGCWKTIETANVCISAGPSPSPMMDDPSTGAKFYSIFFDHLDFTWSLENQMDTNGSDFLFSDNAVRSRLPNIYSVHEKFLGANETKPIYIEEVSGADNTFFYRRIRTQSIALDNDADSSTLPEEVMLVTSEVKWPYRNKVGHYMASMQLAQGE